MILIARIAIPDPPAPPLRLTMKQAIDLSIQNNFTVLLAAERTREAEGREQEAEAPLLPSLDFDSSQANSTINLLAQGLSFHGIPPLAGPFNTFDSRISLSQTLLNLSAEKRRQSSLVDLAVSKMQADLAREQIATTATLGYLGLLRARHSLASAKADLALADALLFLAENQHSAGLADGMDVARARTNRSEQDYKVSRSKTALVRAWLQFKRVLGIPLETQVVLLEPLSFHPASPGNEEKMISEGLSDRIEVKVAQALVRSAELSLEAAKGETDPTLGLSAHYGISGNSPWENLFATRSIGARLDLPLFNGGLTGAHIKEAESRKRQADLTLADTQRQVEEEVRISLETLDSSAALSNYQEARAGLAAAIGHAEEFQLGEGGSVP